MTLACWLIGRPQIALEHGTAALEINRAHGRRRGQSVNLGALSSVYGMLGDLRLKVLLRREALRIADEIGDVRLRESHLCGLVSASVELGDLAAAERHMDEVMRIETASGRGELTPLATGSLAELYAGLGKHEDALPYAEAVARAGVAGCDRRHESDGLVAVAFSLNRLERHAEAVDAADRALRSVKTDLKGTEILALIERAIGRLGLGQVEAARRDASSALGMAREVGDRIREGLALNALAEAALRLEETVLAREHAERARDLLRPIGHFAGGTWSLWLLGAVAHAEGDEAASQRYQREVEDAYAQAELPLPSRYDVGPQRSTSEA
jgi:tetratricopeptide (TPR) repeat protein